VEDKQAGKNNLLKLMRFWLFGTFIIVFAAITVYIGLFTGWQKALTQGLPIWGLTAVLCVLWYFAYRWYLGRKA
jgi:hypothetical protein